MIIIYLVHAQMALNKKMWTPIIQFFNDILSSNERAPSWTNLLP